MNRVPVTSHTLKAVGYNPETLTLELEFINNDLYKYFKVPASVYLELMNANSKGSFFNTRIRDMYDYEKVTKYFS